MRRLLVADALAVAAALAAVALPLPAEWIENGYANGCFAALNRALVPIGNAVPFALGDVFFGVLGGALVAGWIAALRRKRRARAALAAGAHTVGLLALLVLTFEVAWGWNYRRAPVAVRVDYRAERVTPAAVAAFTDRIAAILNDDVDGAHVRMASESPSAMRVQLARDFLPLAVRLGDRWNVATTVPKRTIAVRLYQMAGVGGQYNPWTFETLLDPAFLPFEAPRALAHEWTHVAGFGDEGDANFVGTLACLRSSDPLIRYSGAYWTFGELPEGERRRVHLRPAVLADFRAGEERFARVYNPDLFRFSWGVYDRYLQVNGVPGGVTSYSRFVRLLVGTRLDADGLPRPAR